MIFNFSLSDIEQLYVGRDKGCRCGCKGEYYTPDTEAGLEKILEILEIFKSGKHKIKCGGFRDERWVKINKAPHTACTLYLKASAKWFEVDA